MHRRLGWAVIVASLMLAAWLFVVPYLQHRRAWALEEATIDHARDTDPHAKHDGFSLAAIDKAIALGPERDRRRDELERRGTLAIVVLLAGSAFGAALVRRPLQQPDAISHNSGQVPPRSPDTLERFGK